MSVEVIPYRSRGKREEAERIAKEKRQKVVLGVGLVLLCVLVALEGPKTLKKLHGQNTTAPVPASSSAPASPSVSPAGGHSVDLSAIRRLGVKDPFLEQLGEPATGTPQLPAASGPAVRDSHFVAKDLFAQQVTLSATPSDESPSTPVAAGAQAGAATGAAASGSGDLIVVIESVPLTDGRTAAARAAATARTRGVGNVAVVNSSSYPTLRSGFYAVYSGPYATLTELLAALEQVRGQGYPSAYTRRLAH